MAVPYKQLSLQNYKLLLIAIFFSIVTFASKSYSEPKRFEAVVNDHRKFSQKLTEVYTHSEIGENIKFSIVLFKEGRINFALSKTEIIENGTIHLFQGSKIANLHKKGKKNRRGVSKSTATLYKDDSGLHLKVTFSIDSLKGYKRFYEANYNSGEKTARIVTAPQFALYGKTCGDDSHSTSALEADAFAYVDSSSIPTTLPAVYREVEVATDADCQAVSTFGSSLNATVAGYVNAASSVYQSNMGIKLNVKAQTSHSSCAIYPSSDSGTLLDSFRTFTNNNQQLGAADTYFLFSGKDIDSNVIGLAFLGVVCEAPTYSYGMFQHVNSSLNHVIFAHELGHNLGADHSSSGIMQPSLGSPAPSSFSSDSISAITNFVASSGSCMATVSDTDPTPPPGSTPTPIPPTDATPAPTPTNNNGGGNTGSTAPDLRFSGRASKTKFSGKVKLSQFIEGCTLRFIASGKNDLRASSKTIAIVEPISANTAVVGKFTRRLKGNNKKIYFGMVYSCPDMIDNFSNEVAINASKIPVSKQASVNGVVGTMNLSFYGY